MLDKDATIKEYEQLLANKVRAEEEYSQIRDKILQAETQLKGLDKQKEVFNKFWIDHEKALGEIEEAKQKSREEIKRFNDNQLRNINIAQLNLDKREEVVKNREQKADETEKRQHQENLSLTERENKVTQKEQTAEAKFTQAKLISEGNKSRQEELDNKEANIKKDRQDLDRREAKINSDTQENAGVLKSIQRQSGEIIEENKKLKQCEEKVKQDEEKNNRRSQELDNRQAELDTREAKQNQKEVEYRKNKKNLDDKEKNLNAEKDDLDFGWAKLNTEIKKAKRTKILNK